MGTAIQDVKKMLNELPDDSSFEDIQYHIYVREKVEKGLKDIEEGQVVSQEKAEKRMAKWLLANGKWGRAVVSRWKRSTTLLKVAPQMAYMTFWGVKTRMFRFRRENRAKSPFDFRKG